MREPKVPITTPQPTTQPAAQAALQPSTLTEGRQQRLESLLSQMASLAEEIKGDPEQLLDLLRQLEMLHRSIQDGAFRSSLPADRNLLFNLLRRMEQSGGWPYIPRLQLRTFIDLLQVDAAEEEAARPEAPASDADQDQDQDQDQAA